MNRFKCGERVKFSDGDYVKCGTIFEVCTSFFWL